ncbi:MAG: hypothetical protein H7338_14685 [Candidatus Sericytochromatia bacterium]|nr:hypothetical protein [Candidatus Sericytochromatia bacterium]
MSVSVSSVTASARSGFEHLRDRLTGPVGVRATTDPAPMSDPGDVYHKVGTIVDPIGLVSAAYATKATVTAVSSVFTGGGAAAAGDLIGEAVTHASGFAKGFAAVKAGAAANIGIGAAFGAGLSLVGNAIGLIRGKLSPGQAAGGIAADTVGAAISATGAVVLGGAATVALGAIGLAGAPLTLAGIGVSMLAGWAVDAAYRRSNVAGAIYKSVSGALGG